nr:rhodanese-like domain-containing protein [Kouleothrix sp.]
MTVDPLVSVEWLKDHLGDPQVRAVDVRWYLTEPHRGRADYDAAHLPGAVFMDIDGDLAAPRGQGPFSDDVHGVLDAMTDGGLGVAFFAPFSATRYFFPFRPIPGTEDFDAAVKRQQE